MKRFEMMVTATLRKNLGRLMPKQNDDSGRPRAVLFVSYQIYVENKQHFSSLSTNNPLSKQRFTIKYLSKVTRLL